MWKRDAKKNWTFLDEEMAGNEKSASYNISVDFKIVTQSTKEIINEWTMKRFR